MLTQVKRFEIVKNLATSKKKEGNEERSIVFDVRTRLDVPTLSKQPKCRPDSDAEVATRLAKALSLNLYPFPTSVVSSLGLGLLRADSSSSFSSLVGDNEEKDVTDVEEKEKSSRGEDLQGRCARMETATFEASLV